MAGQQRRTVLIAIIGVSVAWLLAFGGYQLAKRAKVTPEQVAQLVHSLDLSKLSPAERARALRDLANKLNGLSPEDRRQLRPDMSVYEQMTEEEKEQFVEDTMPMQVKQALNAFEHLNSDQRQKAIDSALNEMRARDAGNPDGNA